MDYKFKCDSCISLLQQKKVYGNLKTDRFYEACKISLATSSDVQSQGPVSRIMYTSAWDTACEISVNICVLGSRC